MPESPDLLADLATDLRSAAASLSAAGFTPSHPARLMEVCGGQTHAILRYGIDDLLPPAVRLVHGPGCPVCVTPASYLDRAIALARTVPGLVLATFADLLRVPSAASGDLYSARAAGADVRTVLSPLHALELARRNPSRPVVFLAIGFETTAPANALALELARRDRIANFFLLSSHFLVPPVLRRICGLPDPPHAFLAAGHVCTVAGSAPYADLAAQIRRPVVVTGFTPAELLRGITAALRLLVARRPVLFNAYPEAVLPHGNPHAQRLVSSVFEPCDREWRGLGLIPQSGLRIRPDAAPWDADRAFPQFVPPSPSPAASPCPAAEVLLGHLEPPDCPLFAKTCRPDNPLGAPMVSPEGPCAAFFLHRPRTEDPVPFCSPNGSPPEKRFASPPAFRL